MQSDAGSLYIINSKIAHDTSSYSTDLFLVEYSGLNSRRHCHLQKLLSGLPVFIFCKILIIIVFPVLSLVCLYWTHMQAYWTKNNNDRHVWLIIINGTMHVELVVLGKHGATISKTWCQTHACAKLFETCQRWSEDVVSLYHYGCWDP